MLLNPRKANPSKCSQKKVMLKSQVTLNCAQTLISTTSLKESRSKKLRKSLKFIFIFPVVDSLRRVTKLRHYFPFSLVHLLASSRAFMHRKSRDSFLLLPLIPLKALVLMLSWYGAQFDNSGANFEMGWVHHESAKNNSLKHHEKESLYIDLVVIWREIK